MRGKRVVFSGERGGAQRPADWPARLFILLLFLFLPLGSVWAAQESKAADDSAGAYGNVAEPATGSENAAEYGNVTESEAGSQGSSEYGNVTSAEVTPEGPKIADPLQPFNRAMYHFNDKMYFWVFEPVAKVYKWALPEGIRGIMANFYRNVRAPVRIVNNLLQGKPKYAGIELGKFLINSTMGVGGLKDCATECFGIKGRNAEFGQTLGKYGVGFGFYIVWPFLGPSCPRDTVGWVANEELTPTTYLSSNWISPITVGLYVHEEINDLSFHIGDYEALKAAAIDPYVAIRDAYVQHRTKVINE